MARALKESKASAPCLSDSDDESDAEERAPSSDEDDGGFEHEDENEDKFGAPGMMTDFGAAQRWWEGSQGFDFAAQRKTIQANPTARAPAQVSRSHHPTIPRTRLHVEKYLMLKI